MKPLQRIRPSLIGWRDDLGDQPPANLSGTISPNLRGSISPNLRGSISPDLWGTISFDLWGNCTGLTGNIASHVQEEGE